MAVNIIVKVEKSKLKDREFYFELDLRHQGITLRSPPVCMDTSDTNQFEKEVTASLNYILGMVDGNNLDE